MGPCLRVGGHGPQLPLTRAGPASVFTCPGALSLLSDLDFIPRMGRLRAGVFALGYRWRHAALAPRCAVDSALSVLGSDELVVAIPEQSYGIFLLQ